MVPNVAVERSGLAVRQKGGAEKITSCFLQNLNDKICHKHKYRNMYAVYRE